MALDKFPFVPHGDVRITYAWETDEVEFQDGSKKYPRRRIHAKKTYSFTIGGLDVDELVDFYNSKFGMLEPFLFTYDGITEKCYFSNELNPTVKVGGGIAAGYECNVELEVATQVTSYPPASENDILPLGHGDYRERYDWNTNLYAQRGSTARRKTYLKPSRKMTVIISGTKETRDKVISLYNSHEMIPLLYEAGGKRYRVRFPVSMEITDRKELGKVVGFETEIDLEVLSCEQISS